MKPSALKSLVKSPIFLALLFIAVLSVAGLELTDTTHIFHAEKVVNMKSSGSQFTKGESGSKDSDGDSLANGPDSSASNPEDSKANAGSSGELLAPSGTFVSAHKNVPASATLSSVCNTSSGAQCYISFKMGEVTKRLASQATDKGGSAYWSSWTPASVGLTTGTWKVQATASMDGQSKTSDDAVDLVVVE